jgi:hypothetical protein
MSVFMVEAYRSLAMATETAAPEDLSRAADQLTSEGVPVHLVHAVFVPHEEMCFYLFEAVSSEAVTEVARRCSLPFERLVDAVSGWTRGKAPTTATRSLPSPA